MDASDYVDAAPSVLSLATVSSAPASARPCIEFMMFAVGYDTARFGVVDASE